MRGGVELGGAEVGHWVNLDGQGKAAPPRGMDGGK